MKVFIDVKTGKSLCKGLEAQVFKGYPWRDMQEKGEAVWVDVPEGEHFEDCVFVVTPVPHLEVVAEKSAERKKKAKDKADRKAALDAIDHTKKLSADDLDTAVRAWLADRKGE